MFTSRGQITNKRHPPLAWSKAGTRHVRRKQVTQFYNSTQQQWDFAHLDFGNRCGTSSRSYRAVTATARDGRGAADWELEAAEREGRLGAPEASAQQQGQQQQQDQELLNAVSIKQYVANNPTLSKLLGAPGCLKAEELLDGVINLVYVGENEVCGQR